MEYDIEKILTMYEDDYTPAIGPRAMVGEITDQQTQFGRPIYQTPGGERVSEKSTTLFLNGNWMNVPSIHGGKSFNEDELRLMIKRGNIEPTSVHKSKNEAEAAAKARSDSMVPGPRNMYASGQLVSNTVDGSRPGYAGNKDKTTKIKNFIGKKKKIKKTEIIKLLNDLKYPNWSTQLAKLKERGYFDNVEIIDDYKRTANTLEEGGSRISQVEDIFKNWKSTGKTNYTKQELIEALPEGAYEKNKAAYDTAENKIKKNYKSIKLIEQSPDRSKPLPKSVQQKLVEAFPEIDFKFGTKAQPGYGIRKYGVSKKDIGEVLYNEIQAFAKYNLEPQFPKGDTPEGKLLHQMFRSTQPGSGGGIRFQLVDKNGKVIPKEKYPKNWRKNEAYKNIRILDTETGDIIKYTDDIKGKGISMKEYINKVEKNPQAYNQALESYKLQKNISTTPYMYKGKEYTLGGTLNKNRVIENFKKEFKRNPTKDEMKNLFRSNNVGSWQVHHPEGVANNWWKSEVVFRDANMKLNYIDKNLKASLKTINNPGEKTKLIKQVSTEVKKLPGGISYIFEGQELGKPSNLKSVMKSPISQANLKAGERKAMEKALLKFAGTITDKCKIGNAEGGRIGFKTGSEDCLRIAKQGLEKGLKTGFPKNQQALAEGILKSGRFLKDAVSLRGLFGPAALAFTAAAEAGIVGYDMLASGKSFREAVGDSVFNYMLGDKTKIDSVEERNKRMIEEGMTPEQMGKIGAMESALEELNTFGSQFNKLAAIQKNRDAISMSPEDTFSEGAFQLDLDRQENEARKNIQDFNRSGGPQRLQNIDYAGGFENLAEGLRRNELAQLQSVNNPLEGPISKEKRSARIRELMLQNPDVRNYMGPYPTNYGFKEGGIASLNVKK
jgi:hypothetical protein